MRPAWGIGVALGGLPLCRACGGFVPPGGMVGVERRGPLTPGRTLGRRGRAPEAPGGRLAAAARVSEWVGGVMDGDELPALAGRDVGTRGGAVGRAPFASVRGPEGEVSEGGGGDGVRTAAPIALGALLASGRLKPGDDAISPRAVGGVGVERPGRGGMVTGRGAAALGRGRSGAEPLPAAGVSLPLGLPSPCSELGATSSVWSLRLPLWSSVMVRSRTVGRCPRVGLVLTAEARRPSCCETKTSMKEAGRHDHRAIRIR